MQIFLSHALITSSVTSLAAHIHQEHAHTALQYTIYWYQYALLLLQKITDQHGQHCNLFINDQYTVIVTEDDQHGQHCSLFIADQYALLLLHKITDCYRCMNSLITYVLIEKYLFL